MKAISFNRSPNGAITMARDNRNRARKDPTKAEWTSFCRTMTATEIEKKRHFGSDRIRRLSELYGIAPYQRCMKHGLLSRDNFKQFEGAGTAKYCNFCDKPPHRGNEGTHSEDIWLSRRFRFGTEVDDTRHAYWVAA